MNENIDILTRSDYDIVNSNIKARRRRKNMRTVVMPHLTRIGVILFNTVCGNLMIYAFIGMINRMWGACSSKGRPVSSVFCFFAENKKYLNTLVYTWYAPIVRWKPGFGRIQKQNGKWVLAFGISSNDKDFRSADRAKLQKLYDRMEFTRKLIGAETMTFAGSLPGIFVKRGIMNEKKSIEAENTSMAVRNAIDKVVELEGIHSEPPLVILGGRGFIGSRLTSDLRDAGYRGAIMVVDLGDQFKHIKKMFAGQPAIVINLTKKGVLDKYLDFFWPQAIIINEVYPEPSRLTIQSIKEIGCSIYHISGFDGWSFPPYPRAYSGSIPCCSSIKGDFDVNVKKL